MKALGFVTCSPSAALANDRGAGNAVPNSCVPFGYWGVATSGSGAQPAPSRWGSELADAHRDAQNRSW